MLMLAARLHPVSDAFVPVVLGFVAVGSVRSRRPSSRYVALVALVLCGFASESVLTVRALAGLRSEATTLSGTATLLRDPISETGAVRADVRLAGRHFIARARGPDGALLRPMLAGQNVFVTGSVRPASQLASWRIARHLAGDFIVTSLRPSGPGSPLARLANGIRSRLLASARELPTTDRTLFAGFVLGDGRDQSVLVTDDFRGSGLTHLLVVSGQNVAFTLAVFRPLIGRLRLRGRLVANLTILLVFAAVTRFEPSVLRAAWMAAIATTATTVGRRQSPLRVLALAAIVLLLIDPLLAWSVGFGLSIAACLGLALLTPGIESALRGHRWPPFLATPVATALGAELGVAVLLVPAFGGIPLVSLPASLLALPAAEPVMAWGVAAGLPAGLLRPLVGSWPSKLVHVPTRLALDWVRHVASFAANLPLGEIDARHFVGAGVLFLVARLAHASGVFVRRRRTVGRAFAFAAVAVLLHPILAQRNVATVALSKHCTAVGIRGRTQRHVDVLLLDHGVKAGDVLQAVRRARIGAVDLVVVVSGGRPQSMVVQALAGRIEIGAVLTGDRVFAGHVRPVVMAEPELQLVAGSTRVYVEDVRGGRLTVSTNRAA